jgi:acetyl esterase/lipase
MNRQANYRKIVSQLSKRTGLPCVTVDQRLAPQHPFPAALLDVFLAYMALLSPPPGCPHPEIPASSIVIAGDSSGGCLALGLLQLLLEINRSGITSIECYGRKIQLGLPAGLTILSGVADLTNSLPSYEVNAKTDVFPPGPPPASLPGFPCCEIWPSKPPRGNVYCETEMLCHPICSPIMAEDWTGAPPLWFASGQEQVIDGIKIVAKTASSQGVEVIFYEYESMPHTFMWVLSESPQHQKFWDDWTEACKMLVKGASPPSRGGFVEVLGLTTKHVKIEELTQITAKEARNLVNEASRTFPVFVGRPNAAPKL